MSNKVIEDYYRAEYNNLIKRVKNRAGSIENAEDVVQEAFCRALQYFDTCTYKDNFGAWFRTILDNTLRDFKRDERMEGMVVAPIEEGIEENIHDEIVDHYLPNVKDLKPHHKKMVRMYFVLGHTMPEIAAVLGVPLNNVIVFFHRFKEKIRAND